MKEQYVYIGTPYTATEGFEYGVKFDRYKRVTKFAAQLMAHGLHVYSPITHCHPMSIVEDLPGNWEYWAELDKKVLNACTAMIVYQQDGWDKSEGLKKEIDLMAAQNKPVLFIPEGMPAKDVIKMLKDLIPTAKAHETYRDNITKMKAKRAMGKNA